jgi:hypothetical protein
VAASANPARGQLGFEVDGEQFVFSFGTNALCAVEDAFGLDDIRQLEGVLKDKPSIRTIRTLFRIGLADMHEDMDDREAGRIMDAVGGLEEGLQLITLAIEQAFPEASGSAGSPRKAQTTSGRGTGRRSTSSGARSAATRSNSGG